MCMGGWMGGWMMHVHVLMDGWVDDACACMNGGMGGWMMHVHACIYVHTYNVPEVVLCLLVSIVVPLFC